MKAALLSALVAAPAAATHAHYAKVAKWQRIRREGPCQPEHEVCVEKFKEELRAPPVATPEVVLGEDGTTVLAHKYTIPMVAASQKLHPDLPPTPLFTYGGTFPGPTIRATVNVPVWVEFPNKLPSEHIIPVDPTVCDSDPTKPSVRASVHLHGGHQPWQYDGNAFAWYTAGYNTTGPDWREKVYKFPNTRNPGLLFYHDHAACITRLNVYAGLSGLYLLEDPALERKLKLPSGEYDMPLVLQERALNPDGSLQYPSDDGIVPEFFGNISVVNGQAWPRMTVEPRKYRFRMLNAANSRFYNLQLFHADNEGAPIFDRPGPKFTVIGTDGGYLHRPTTVPDRMMMGPAERYDVVIDFSRHRGESFILHNNAGTPYSGPGEESGDEVPLTDVMAFHVGRWTREEKVAGGAVVGEGDKPLPPTLVPLPTLQPTADTKTWRIDMREYGDNEDRLMLLLEGSHCEDPIITKPELGATDIFEFINTTPDYHPMHVHLVSFQILGHRTFDVEEYFNSGTVVYTSNLTAPNPWESGWKDTVRVPVGSTTQVIAKFDRAGPFMFHCHILEHEDYDMMRFYEVVPSAEQLAADPELAADYAESQKQTARLGKGKHKHAAAKPLRGHHQQHAHVHSAA